jgi:hypothetical protein
MTDHRPTPPPWWAVHPEPDCRPVILVSQREYKEIERKKREEQEAAHAAARRKAKSKASMERRARRKGAVPPQLSRRGRGRPQITSMEARRLAQKVMKVIYTEDCRRGTAYRHVAESERQRIAQDPRAPIKGGILKTARSATCGSFRTRPTSIFGVRFWTILYLLLGSTEISRAGSCAGFMNRQVLSGSSPMPLMTRRE